MNGREVQASRWRVGSSAVRLAAALAMLVALLLGGCGDEDVSGQDETSGGVAAERARAAYIEAADEICAEALVETRRVARRALDRIPKLSGSPVQATTDALIKPGIEVRERQAEALNELERPPEDDADLDRFLDLFATIDEISRQRLRAGRAGDVAGSARLERILVRLAAEQQAAARAFGFEDCSVDVIAEALS